MTSTDRTGAVDRPDGVDRFPRRGAWLRINALGLGGALIFIPLLRIRAADAGWELLWVVAIGALLVAAAGERGPDQIDVERHAIVVHGGRSLRRPWTTRLERNEIRDVRIDRWWLVIHRTDGERLRYWVRPHDRASLNQSLERWRRHART